MKFRKKPVVIEAVQWTGGYESIKDLIDFNNSGLLWTYVEANQCIEIPTLEGNMYASVGDWIIKGIKGEFYPCKPDIFEATYEQEPTVRFTMDKEGNLTPTSIEEV
jgi:hypothetical protein